jgi:lipopolysaccharide transport system ATP-binding protein
LSESNRAAVSVHRLRKKFHRGERHDSLRDLIPAVARKLTGRAKPDPRGLRDGDFWAIDDVSFEVRPGEALGIIGPNGAGKSTMLKLLTKILRPTTGRCEVRGRIGALIEIAAGFHPDLTGRENAYLQGAIMGMSRAEVAAVLDEIIDFAGVEAFIDTPTKRYSSGMNARLGFSIAAHVNPDVLIIDEVLAVGDMAFQQKCLERMRAFKAKGAAIVFVSHNMQAIADLCDRAIFLKSSVRAEGPVLDVVRAYLTSSESKSLDAVGGPVDIVARRFTGADGSPVEAVTPGALLRLEVDYVVNEPVDYLHFGMLALRSTDGLLVYYASIIGEEVGLINVEVGQRFTLRFDFRTHLARGQYHLECRVHRRGIDQLIARLSPAGLFTVNESRTHQGMVDLELEVSQVSAPIEVVAGA